MSKWKIIALSIAGVVLIIATVILVILFKKAIFTENTLMITLMVIYACFLFAGSILVFGFKGRQK